MNPQIIFEDDNFLALNKPTGMIANKADTTADIETVQDWVENNVVSQKEKILAIVEKYGVSNVLDLKGKTIEGEYNTEIEFALRGGVVHRLDKETSGILLIAKNPDTFAALKKQFKERTITKEYEALVHGEVTPPFGFIDKPLGRLPWNRTRFGVLAQGREAFTEYTTISHYRRIDKVQKEIFSLLSLHPKTGRTHQIRVHLQSISHPVVGDLLYAGRKASRNDREWCPRLFLHAKTITFINPTLNQETTITAPLPQELQVVLESLTAL